jgi:hypothetical protein
MVHIRRHGWSVMGTGAAVLLFVGACATSPVADYAISAPVHLPLTMMQSGPVATVMVGDTQVVAGVDTGGGPITLTSELIEGAGGKRVHGHYSGTDAYGRPFRIRKYRVPAISIGGQTFRDVVVAQDTGASHDGPALQASIGRHFLSHFFVVIDYAGHAMTLWPSAVSAEGQVDCGTRRIPMEFTWDSRLVIARFETPSGPLRAIFDTGATGSFLPEALADQRHLPLTQSGNTRFYSVAALTAAGQDLGPLEFVVLPLQPPHAFQAFIGADFFARHVVCLDYAHREIRIR